MVVLASEMPSCLRVISWLSWVSGVRTLLGRRVKKTNPPKIKKEMAPIDILAGFDSIVSQVYHGGRMKRKWWLVVILVIGCLGMVTGVVMAKKRLKRNKAPQPYGAWVKPKLRSDGRALLLMLGGMQQADKVEYTLTYNAGPIPQGIESYHTPSDGNTMKELVFGTCSGDDCIYHGNINEMKLEITMELKDDRTVIQRYEINVPEPEEEA